MDELSYWLNKPSAPLRGLEGEEIAEAPPQHYASAGSLSDRVRLSGLRLDNRKHFSIPGLPALREFFADLASVPLPSLAEPVIVAGSVAALVAATTFGVNSVGTGKHAPQLAADRAPDPAASRGGTVEDLEKKYNAPAVAPLVTTTTTIKPQTPTPAPAPAPAKVQTVAKHDSTVVGDDVWAKLSKCEASGNAATNTGNGYYGAFQFSAGTWKSLGGTGLPSQADYATQKDLATKLQQRSGWGQWPACSAKLGLRH